MKPYAVRIAEADAGSTRAARARVPRPRRCPVAARGDARRSERFRREHTEALERLTVAVDEFRKELR